MKRLLALQFLGGCLVGTLRPPIPAGAVDGADINPAFCRATADRLGIAPAA